MLLLAGDVGGTKTALALTRGAEIIERRTYPSAAFDSLEAMVGEFLGERAKEVTRACFGVAGPVSGDVGETTNLRWTVDARRIEQTLGLPRVHLVNDFTAMAHGIPLLSGSDFAAINEGTSDPHGPWVLLGAGTGLGQAVVVRTPGGHVQVIPSEGGHTDFAPRNEEEIELLRFLLKRHKRVSYERIISGPGLVNLYQFVRERSPRLESGKVRDELAAATGNHASIVSKHGLARSDVLCDQALSLFVSIYGAEAGNLALKVIARGGVYIGGGIAPKILPRLLDGTFRTAFTTKGRLSPMLEGISVKVVTNPDAGMIGAASLAATLGL